MEKHHNEDFLRQSAEAKARVEQVNPSQVDTKFASGTVILDVREAEEHEESRVEGAVNINIAMLGDRIASAIPDKGTPIICYCNGGNRGSLAAAKLLDLGYTNVGSIAGGLRAYTYHKNQQSSFRAE
jgi:phage shock protein E